MIEDNIARFGDIDLKKESMHFLEDEVNSYESMSSIDSYDDQVTIHRKRKMTSIKKLTNKGNYNEI